MMAMAALAAMAIPAFAQVSQTLAFQGKLGDANGNPLTGSYNFTFSIIPSTGGAAVYTETDSNVSVTNGIYTVYIGSYVAGGIPASTFNVPVVLQVSVDGELLAPDIPIASVSSAFHAIYADQLLSPMTTATGGTGQNWGPGNAPAGSIPYFITNGSMTLLAPSLNTYVLTMNASGLPYWAAPGAASVTSATNTWSAQQTFDNALYVSTSLALSGPLSLSNGAGAYGQVLESSGAGYAPFWASVAGPFQLLNDTNTWTAEQQYDALVVVSSGIASSLYGAPVLTLSGGDVGISTTNIAHALEVGGTINAQNYLLNGSPLSSAASLLSTTNTWTAEQQYSALIVASSGIASSLYGAPVLTLSGGDVGISTTNIAHALEVGGIVNAQGFDVNGAPIPLPDSLLSSTNTWTAQQNFLNEVFISSDISVSGNIHGSGQDLTNLPWNQLTPFPSNCPGGSFFTALSVSGGTCTGFATAVSAHSITEMNATDDKVTASPLYDLNGFVGLGTVLPNAELEISSPALGGTTNPVLIVSTGASAADRLFIVNGSGSVGISTGLPQAPLDIESVNSAGYSLQLSSGISMPVGTINAHLGLFGGSVGIGTNSPETTLHVNGSGGNGTIPSSAYTSAQLGAATPPALGIMVFDSTLNEICLSTGTTVGSWGCAAFTGTP
jgi:hypothetical protein